MAKSDKRSAKSAPTPESAPAAPALGDPTAMPRTLLWIIFAAEFILAALMRNWRIDLRPLHNDEGVNWYFIQDMLTKGYFPYSHENYHGPAFFYFMRGLIALFGGNDSEWVLRLSAILPGLALVAVPLLFRRKLGDVFALAAAGFIAVSPSLIFYSRYAIHETLFVLAGAILGIALFLWKEDDRAGWLLVCGAALGILISTKETFIITLFCLALALAATGGVRATVRRLWDERRILAYCALIAVAIIVYCFSGGLQWMGGVREMFLGVPQWIGRNKSDYGHWKPFFYYTKVILETEPDLVVGIAVPAALGAAWLLRAGLSDKVGSGDRFFAREYAPLRFFFVWTLSSWVVYGIVKYKTPWLIISITLPAVLLLAWWFEELARRAWNAGIEGVVIAALGLLMVSIVTAKSTGLPIALAPWGALAVGAALVLGAMRALESKGPLRSGALYVSAAAAVLLAGSTTASACRYNFSIPYGPFNPFSYVHTSPGMLDLVANIRDYWKRYPQAMVLVGVDGYWPLPYYLRGHDAQVHYLKDFDLNSVKDKYDILILEKELKLSDPGWAIRYLRLSEVEETNAHFRRHT
jgi:uncharacterized protein (TIGR03663 family)